jgi:hypothetical protein
MHASGHFTALTLTDQSVGEDAIGVEAVLDTVLVGTLTAQNAPGYVLAIRISIRPDELLQNHPRPKRSMLGRRTGAPVAKIHHCLVTGSP